MSERQAVGDDAQLLEVLLEYVRQTLGADHACLTEAAHPGGGITVIAAAGRLEHAELWPGMGELAQDEYGYDAPPPWEDRSLRINRLGNPATPGITAYLTRIGAAYDVTVRVFEHASRLVTLELYYCDLATPFGDERATEASRLAPMLAAVVIQERLAARLAEAEERFRRLVEQLPAITFVVHSNGDVDYSSPQLVDMLGLEAGEGLANAWAERLHPDDRDRVVVGFRAHLEHGRSFEMEHRYRHPDGRELWFVARARALLGPDGEVTGSQGVLFDITDRKRAEEALRDAERRRQQVLEEMLRAEGEARGQIAADLHDDTVQVIAASQLVVERAARAVASGRIDVAAAALEDATAILRTAVERTRRMTFELRPPLLEAQGLAAAVSELTGEVARECGFHAMLDLQVGRYSRGVEDLAYRTVKEALANVRKHAHADRVRVRLADGDGQLLGEVADDGRGFEVERALDRRTMRLHMGLDTMRERLALAGGRFDVSSRPGEGSSVQFTIPTL